jgi:dihydrofolate reductase
MQIGGAEIASTFINLGIIDEYRAYLAPILIGKGKPMFRSLAKNIALEVH